MTLSRVRRRCLRTCTSCRAWYVREARSFLTRLTVVRCHACSFSGLLRADSTPGRDRHQSRACAGSRAAVAAPAIGVGCRGYAWMHGGLQPGPALRRDAPRGAHAADVARRGRRPAPPATPGLAARRARRATSTGESGSVSVILWGPPGTGKTTLAQAIARSLRAPVRRALRRHRRRARRARGDGGGADAAATSTGSRRCSSSTRSTASRRRSRTRCCPGVENGWVILDRGDDRESLVLGHLAAAVAFAPAHARAAHRRRPRHAGRSRGRRSARARRRASTLEPEARDALVRLASGDARRALTALEAAASLAEPAADDVRSRRRRRRATTRPRHAAVDHRRHRGAAPSTARCCATTGRATSTTTSSARSSSRSAARDVDAALHYLARMIEAGEDPRFIARRIIISAAEDIGLADPQALGDRRGGGRRRAVHRHARGAHPARRGGRATSRPTPKSNAAYLGIDAAIADVRAGRIGRVPTHLRDAHYPGAKRLGHGKGYVYPHDIRVGVVAQQYLPDELRGATLLRADRARQRARRAGPARRRSARIVRGERLTCARPARGRWAATGS